MITNSIDSISSSYLQRMQEDQANGKTGANAITTSPSGSSFSQLLSLSGADVAEASTSSSTTSGNNANQLMNQLLASYKNSSVDAQSQSLDSSSIGQ